MDKTTIPIIKTDAEKISHKIVLNRQKAYMKPFFNAKKIWAQSAVLYISAFAIKICKLTKEYQRACVKAIKVKELFTNTQEIKKAKKYKTHEYLDDRYNRVVVSDIKDTLVTLKEKFEDSMKSSYDNYVVKGSARDSAEFVYNDMGMEFNFNKFDQATRSYLNEKSIKWSKAVAKETEDVIKQELVRGFGEGLGSYEIAKNVMKSSGFSYRRSEAIARTEIMSSNNYIDYMAATDNPDVIGSKWSATGDGRTRPTHTAANGQKRKKGVPFDVGGYKLMFPLDGSLGAPAKEISNCRCTLLSIFKGEDLESKTVYDEKDAGSFEWVNRQPEGFQEEYWNGKTKKALGKTGLLDLKDKEKPLKEILDQLYPVKIKAEDITKVSDLPDATAKEVIKRANALWLYGKLNGREANVTLNAVTGKKVCKNVIGIHGSIPKTSENYDEWIKYLDNAKDNSAVLIHNHNNVSAISIEDLLFFLKRKSVKSMFVVDDGGNLCFIEKTSNAMYNTDIEKIKTEIESILTMNYIKLINDKRWFAFSKERQSEINKNFYFLVLKNYLKEKGVKFEKW